MRSIRLVVAFLVVFAIVAVVGRRGVERAAEAPAAAPPVALRFLDQPLAFEPLAEPGRYGARGLGYGLALSAGEAELVLGRTSAAPLRVRMRLEGANPAARLVARRPLPGRINYCVGPREDWRLGVPTSAQVMARGVYRGIDLVYYGNQRRLEYDFHVRPGADPTQIGLRIDGAPARLDPAGDLLLATEGEPLRFHRPIAYQEIEGERRPVAARYLVRGQRVAFAVGDYDRDRELIIDPLVTYARYLSGAGTDWGIKTAVDSSNRAYITGSTTSASLVGVAGNHGGRDGFATRLSAAGEMEWLTFVGGGGEEFGMDLAVDASGRVFLTGLTESADFAGAAGSGDDVDGYAVRLAAAGTVDWAVYLAGPGEDRAYGIATDGTGAAWVCGSAADGFEGLPGYAGGPHDGFVVHLDNTGNQVWGKFFGGSGGSGNDVATDLTLDASKRPFVTGMAECANFGGQTVVGQSDAFVVCVKADGSALQWSRITTTAGNDIGYGIALDSSARPVICGHVTPGNFGGGDALTVWFQANGTGIDRISWTGGSGFDTAYAMALDGSNRVFAAGETFSDDFFGATGYGGAGDGFVMRLGTNGLPQRSLYVGTSAEDELRGLALDSSGQVYLTGYTDSNAWPGASGTPLGDAEAIALKLDLDAATKLAITTQPGLTPGNKSVSLVVAVQDLGGQVVTNQPATVNVTLNNANGATLENASMTTVDGVATFTNLFVSKKRNGYTLTVSATGLTSATSGSFNVIDPVVTTDTDSGAGSLRQAIIFANSNGGNCTIGFDIGGGGMRTLFPSTPLPAITVPGVTIDGTDQPGYTNKPLIGINSVGQGSGDTLQCTGGTTTIKGLAINAAPGNCLSLSGNGNIVQSSYIGLTQTDSLNGPGGHGIVISGSNNTIGGAGAGNQIAGAKLAGVAVTSGSGNRIGSNSIVFSGLGISLSGTVTPTANDSSDPDSGSNNLQNYPALTSATLGATNSLEVTGSIDSATANSAYPIRIEIFSNTQASANGTGQGRTFLGSTDVAAPGSFTLSNLLGPSAGQVVTATATDANGNTSEFAPAMTISGPAAQIVFTGQPADRTAGVAQPAITVELRDSGNRLVRAASGDVVLRLGNNPGGDSLELTATPVQGVATFNGVTLTKAGSGYTLSATSGALSTASNAFAVTPAAVAAAASSASVPATGTAGTLTPATVTTRDAFSNPLTTGGAAVVATVSGANAGKQVSVTDQGDGSYALSYTPTVVGVDQIAISIGNAAVAGSPFSSTIGFGALSAPLSTAVVPAGTAGSTTNIVATVRDVAGNVRTAGGDAVAGSVTGANNGALAVVDNGNGTYTLSYTPTVVGTDQVAITAGGTAIGGSPFSSTIGFGALSAPLSAAVVPAGTVGSATVMTVTVRDVAGNVRTAGGDAVAGSVTGANNVALAVVDNGNGTYTLSYTPSLAGTDRLAITVGGVAIGGSPFSSLVGGGGPTTSAAHSTATVPGAGTIGIPLNIAIQAREAGGTPRTVGGDLFTVSVTGANSVAPPVTDLGNGSYTAVYTPQAAGNDSIAIALGGTPIAGSPFGCVISQVPVVPSAAQSSAAVPAGVAGAVTTMVIQAKDTAGNNRTVGGDTVTVTVSGANSATPSVTDNGNGTYQASYTPTVAGTDAVAITLNGSAIGGSPYSSQVVHGASNYARSTATVPGGTAGTPTSITIIARDAFGNARTSGGDTVVVTVSGANSASAAVTDLGNGQYRASYTPARAGSDQLAITLNGTAISGSPYGSLVVAGAADPDQSSLTADRAVAAGDGSEAVVLTLVLRDSSGNPLVGVPSSATGYPAEPSDYLVFTALGASDADGRMQAEVRSRRDGTVTIWATANGVRLARSVTIQFLPTTSMVLPAGKQFIGLPWAPNDPRPEAVLASQPQRVMRWRSDLGDYVIHNPGDPDPTGLFNFGPGRGLWISPAAPLHLTLVGTPTPSGPFTLDLPLGWSNLANPFDRDLPWTPEQVTVLVNGASRGTLAEPATWDLVRPYLWLWNRTLGESYTVFPPHTEPTIPRLAGFWALALVDGLQLRVAEPASGLSRARAATPRDWALRLSAQQGTAKATALVGVDSALSRALPIEAPPGGADPLRLEVLTSTGGRAAGALLPGALPAEWQLLVSAASEGEVTLSWPALLRNLPRGVMLELSDPSSGARCLLNTRSAYRYTAARGARRLVLTARTGNLARTRIVGFGAAPNRGRGLAIQLTLSGPATVTVRVRGLNGQQVRSLSQAVGEAGSVGLSWDGADDGGRPVPPGSYQLEAVAVAADGSVSRAVRTVTVR